MNTERELRRRRRDDGTVKGERLGRQSGGVELEDLCESVSEKNN